MFYVALLFFIGIPIYCLAICGNAATNQREYEYELLELLEKYKSDNPKYMDEWKSRSYAEGLEIKIKNLKSSFVKLKVLSVICMIISWFIGLECMRADSNGVSLTDALTSILFQ